MSESEAAYWKRCAICKKHIGFNETYTACSVSTCNRKRTALAFCSFDCWDAHAPDHRDAWAEEKTSPAET
jgi:hypothetical protein